MKDFWNTRYAETDFAYGKNPNQFLVSHLDKIPKGKILFVAEGEGRNAVFAAQNGFEVHAFDYSEAAKVKADALAKEKEVTVSFSVFDVLENPYEKESFDAIIFIFAHFPISIRKEAHNKLLHLLKPNGVILFEAFAKDQLKFNSGGPKEEAMLFSEIEIKDEFQYVTFEFIDTKIVNLDEGPYHQGDASIIRFIGKKY
ncbi:class I SAM-dependent methyltransferase [Flavobacterium ardleyense]|uniref:Class I SAM-dependent methyltransferase n=1 Tax=Flavobacterium ardleyense TaxID=2038737 RepID=A0ABW5ZE42_9FLAO